MKKLLIISIFAATLISLGLIGCKPPKTVDYVELDRYLGTWHEIAKFPNSFQGDCYGNTTASYSPHPDFDADIVVLNRCQTSPGGDYQDITGRASIVDKETNAKLRVSFFGPFGAPYWIIEIADTAGDNPYEWAVVSEPFRQFLWILSRTPVLEEDVLSGILEKIALQGFDTERLVFTPQD